jgi:hypothetical protein
MAASPRKGVARSLAIVTEPLKRTLMPVVSMGQRNTS